MFDRWPYAGAFVVQFRPDADVDAGPFEGRIEHVASGRAARFSTLQELREFVTRLLAEMRANDAEVRADPPAGAG
jgi:hypothetical protein